MLVNRKPTAAEKFSDTILLRTNIAGKAFTQNAPCA